MLFCFMGGTCTGKNTLMQKCIDAYGWKPIVRTTSRPMRSGEVDGVDYHFISPQEFIDLLNDKKFIEFETFSNERYYGTLKSELESDEVLCMTLTPQGLLKILNSTDPSMKICVIYVTCSLGDAIIRYVNRVGVESFSVDDKMEMCDRLARDEGMFKGFGELCRNLYYNYPNFNIVFFENDGTSDLVDMLKYYKGVHNERIKNPQN